MAMAAARLEVVVLDVPADLVSQGRALQVRGKEVEADQNARPVDVRHDVTETDVVPAGLRGAAVEGEGDLVGPEEPLQCLDDSSAVAGVRRGVLGEVRRRGQWLPARV